MRTRRKLALAFAAVAVLAGLGTAGAAGIPVGGADAPRPTATLRIPSENETSAAVYTRVPPRRPWRHHAPARVGGAPHQTSMPADATGDLPEPGDVPDGSGQ
jgi:hypothetical protein